MSGTGGKDTDDVSGAARPEDEDPQDDEEQPQSPQGEEAPGTDPDATAAPLPEVAELADACVRFVAARYGVTLDYRPETLSLVDQWVRDARDEAERRAEILDLVQSAAGAYLGEVIRRERGGRWVVSADHSDWKLCLSTVYCAFNPIGMVREALLLEPAEEWHAHFELDPAERPGIEARLEALPAVPDDEYYAPTTRYDVVSIVFEALREGLRAAGLADARFDPEDYG